MPALDGAIWTRVAGCRQGCAISRVVLKSAQRLEVKKTFQCMQCKIFPSRKELGDEDEYRIPAKKRCRESLAMFSSILWSHEVINRNSIHDCLAPHNISLGGQTAKVVSRKVRNISFEFFWLLLLVLLWSRNSAAHGTPVQAIDADCWAEPAGLTGCFRTRCDPPVLPFRVTQVYVEPLGF